MANVTSVELGREVLARTLKKLTELDLGRQEADGAGQSAPRPIRCRPMSHLIDELGGAVRHAPSFDTAAQRVCELLEGRVAHYNWVGVYMVEGSDLMLKAWKGPAPTEHVRIPIGQGICGLAARENRTVVVDDVSKDPRYLACFLSTRSEIVVPIRAHGRVAGEIDIDSDRLAAFNAADRLLLEWVADLLGARAAAGT